MTDETSNLGLSPALESVESAAILRPGDTLILWAGERLPENELDALRRDFAERDVRVIVLYGFQPYHTVYRHTPSAPAPAQRPDCGPYPEREPIVACPARYERPDGREWADRIVYCDLLAGHEGDHREVSTDSTWSPDRSPGWVAVAPPAPVPPADDAEQPMYRVCGDAAAAAHLGSAALCVRPFAHVGTHRSNSGLTW